MKWLLRVWNERGVLPPGGDWAPTPRGQCHGKEVYGSRVTHQTRQHTEFLWTVYTVGVRRNEQLLRLVSEYKTEQRSASSRKTAPCDQTSQARVPGWRAAFSSKKQPEESCQPQRYRASFYQGVWWSDYDLCPEGDTIQDFAENRYIWGKSPERNCSNFLELLLGKYSKFCKDACTLEKERERIYWLFGHERAHVFAHVRKKKCCEDSVDANEGAEGLLEGRKWETGPACRAQAPGPRTHVPATELKCSAAGKRRKVPALT